MPRDSFVSPECRGGGRIRPDTRVGKRDESARCKVSRPDRVIGDLQTQQTSCLSSNQLTCDPWLCL